MITRSEMRRWSLFSTPRRRDDRSALAFTLTRARARALSLIFQFYVIMHSATFTR